MNVSVWWWFHISFLMRLKAVHMLINLYAAFPCFWTICVYILDPFQRNISRISQHTQDEGIHRTYFIYWFQHFSFRLATLNPTAWEGTVITQPMTNMGTHTRHPPCTHSVENVNKRLHENCAGQRENTHTSTRRNKTVNEPSEIATTVLNTVC